MEDLQALICLIFLIPTTILIIKSIRKKQEIKEDDHTEEITNGYKNQYQKRNLLTKNEWYAWKKLKEYTDKNNLIICPKVRLLDLIEPQNDATNHRLLLWKVQAKHIDFVICDSNLGVKAILELDDCSHDTEDRKERDKFVDTVLTDVGYKIIRTRYINEDTFNKITPQEPQANANSTKGEGVCPDTLLQ